MHTDASRTEHLVLLIGSEQECTQGDTDCGCVLCLIISDLDSVFLSTLVLANITLLACLGLPAQTSDPQQPSPAQQAFCMSLMDNA